MSTLKKFIELVVATKRAGGYADLTSAVPLIWTLTLIVSLLLLTPNAASATTKTDQRKGRPPNHSLSRTEVKEAEARLSKLGYGTGRTDGVIDGVARR